jgi:hypothetical protein
LLQISGSSKRTGWAFKNNITKLRFALAASILNGMNELDEFWSEQLNTAFEQAKDSGREDVADYLALKAANDTIRSSEVERLFESIIAAAMSDGFRSDRLVVERETPHSFTHRGGNLSGSLLRLRYGVRCLTVEAGWTRTPNDGFMRLGALAFARTTHFGIPKANTELLLKAEAAGNCWIAIRYDRQMGELDDALIESQLKVLFD